MSNRQIDHFLGQFLLTLLPSVVCVMTGDGFWTHVAFVGCAMMYGFRMARYRQPTPSPRQEK